MPASETVLRRVFARHGPKLADIVLGDGLYLTVPMLRLCRQELRSHLLVKTTEVETLNILQDAEAIFRSEEWARDPQVQHVSGTDAERGMRYEVWAAPGFHHAGFADPLKVARVEVQRLKGPRKGQTERFWIVAADETLPAEQMRELAHLRWSIEIVTEFSGTRSNSATNHAFRALHAAVHSKHAAQAWEALMLLAFTLVLAYWAQVDLEGLWQSRRIRKLTLGYLVEQWLLTLPQAAGTFAPNG